jgi:hypothetical protein
MFSINAIKGLAIGFAVELSDLKKFPRDIFTDSALAVDIGSLSLLCR